MESDLSPASYNDPPVLDDNEHSLELQSLLTPNSISATAASMRSLKVETQTWTRDSHDLFDYETPHVDSRRFHVKYQGRMIRKGDRVDLVETDSPGIYSRNESDKNSTDHLLTVRQNKGRFQVLPGVAKKLWLVVRELECGFHVLQEGDVIKLGRFKLKIKQINKDSSDLITAPELHFDDSEAPPQDSDEIIPMKAQCRICLIEEDTPEDPFVAPCLCKGTIGWIHIECLRRWISGLMNNDSNNTAIFFKQHHCELCKCVFPVEVIKRGVKLRTVNFPNIQPPWIVLENFGGANNKGFHVLSMAGHKSHKLGRGHESDVRIPDVSISRCHAIIKFHNGNFLLEDHNSKFGTLVALKKTSLVEKDKKLSIQVGRTIINFALSEPGEDSVAEELVAETAEMQSSTNPLQVPISRPSSAQGGQNQGIPDLSGSEFQARSLSNVILQSPTFAEGGDVSRSLMELSLDTWGESRSNLDSACAPGGPDLDTEPRFPLSTVLQESEARQPGRISEASSPPRASPASGQRVE